MKTEIEAKFSDVDPVSLRTKLASAGGHLERSETLMRRKNFDFPDKRLALQQNGWVRVRDEGGKVTMSYKQMENAGLHGTKELSVAASDFVSTCDILLAIGLVPKAYHETKRETWKLGGVEVTIDMWPWVPPCVELEGPDERSVHAAATTLGFDWDAALHGPAHLLYQKYYDVTEPEISYGELTFAVYPGWLREKKK